MSLRNGLEGTPLRIQRALLPPPYNAFYGSFGSNQTQTVAGVNQETKISHNFTSVSYGIAVDPVHPTRIVVSGAGVYRFSYSVQLDKQGGGNSLCDLWIKIDDVAVPNSASRCIVAGQQGETFPYCDFILVLNAGQYVEICFTSPDASMAATAFAGAGVVPAVPSIITNCVQIA